MKKSLTTQLISFALLASICSAQETLSPIDRTIPAAPKPADDRPKIIVEERKGVEILEEVFPALLGETEIKDPIESPIMTGDIMARFYREWTGKRVLVSRAAMAKQISFIQPGGLTYREAAELLEQAALLEEMVFLPSISNPNLVKLVLATNSRKNGVPVIRESGALPPGDKVVTYVMVFNHIQPDEAMKVFNSVVSQLNPQGSIVSVPNTSSLIITESTSLIKTLIALKKKIDQPQELSTKKIIELQHADAEEVAIQVQEIMDFSAEQNSLVTSNINPRPAANVANNISPPNGDNPQKNGQILTNVKILSISRTNSLWIMGRPIDIKFAETIIADFDKPIKRRSYYKHKLNFLSVSEFLPIANNAIRRKEGGNQRQARQGVANNARPAVNTGSGNAGLAESERLEYPESILVGKTLLIADNANNSLIVQGPPQSISLIRDLIKEMDIASEQVQITAIFGRYNVSNNADFGIDFARLNQTRGGASFALQNRTGYPLLVDPSSLSTTVTDENGISTTTNNIPEAIAGLSVYGKIGNSFLPTLRALESTGNFKLLARPTIFTTNNKKAILSSGQSIAVPTNTLSQNTGAAGAVAQSTNIEFKNVLLKLEVIPLVNSKDEVTLQISFTNDNIIGSQVIDGNSIPTIGKEEILTTITVPNAGTVALGGLITERDVKDLSGVPILSRIPGLKKLFTTTSKSTIREELVIFIQPRIVDNKAALKEMKENNKKYFKISQNIESAGLLPKLKEKKSTKKKSDPRNNRFRSNRRR